MNREGGLLLVGTCAVDQDASQQKLYFLAAGLAHAGRPVRVLVPDLAANRALLGKLAPEIPATFYPFRHAAAEFRIKNALVSSLAPAVAYVVGLGLRSTLTAGRPWSHPRVIQDLDELPSAITTFSAARRLYCRAIEAVAWRRSHAFTLASDYLVEAARRRRPNLGDKILHLPVAISREEHVVDPALAAALRQRHHGRRVLLYIGSMNRFYQVDELLELAAAFAVRDPTVLIRVLGDGPDLGHFREQAQARSLAATIAFEGHVAREHLASHMDAADTLLFPFHDTLFNRTRCPTKSYHYAAARRPVVTNRLGEVAKLFGESACYYRQGDIADLVAACERALARRDGFSNGLSFEELTWDARAAAFDRWLDQLGWLPVLSR